MVSSCPAVSVPCGIHEAPPHTGLPIGLQVAGRRGREDTVLGVTRGVDALRAA